MPKTFTGYRDMFDLIWYVKSRIKGWAFVIISRPQPGLVVKGMDFWHKNWGRFLVAAGTSPTLPFMAQELLSAELQSMLEIKRDISSW